jgi:hypothetical protein
MDDPADTRDRVMADPELRELPPYLVTGNRFGSYGFGAGLSGIVFVAAPFGHALAWVLVAAAVVLSTTGVVRYVQAGATNRDTAVVGLALGWLGLIILTVEASVALNLPVAAYYLGP